MVNISRSESVRSYFDRHLWLPYLIPFAAFFVLTYIGASWPGVAHLWYGLKTAIVAFLLALFHKRYTGLRWGCSPLNWGIGIAAGILVLAIWVLPEKLLAPLMFTEHGGFNPGGYGLAGPALWAVIAVRLFGAVMVVPLMEEVFWRGFIMRYLISHDFESIALGTFRVFAFTLTSVAFGFEHHRWLVGIIAGVIYGGLLVWRKDLFTCIVAHSVTNLGLGIYVLKTEQWTFW